MEAYRHNLLIAGALTPFLAVVEVCLRNAVNRQLVEHYGRLDWWEAWRGDRLRALRNRVFHHEPVLWLSPTDLGQIYQDGVAMLAWIDDTVPRWCNGHCRLQAAWSAWIAADKAPQARLLAAPQRRNAYGEKSERPTSSAPHQAGSDGSFGQ
ncbi:hypothetical protein [Cupriavidus gilardii]|uniref:hypothetical protein n=1 Tax=Cupriavidus gilardii TaxID=82541 RepID=UPI0018D43FE6|nr:hypothetical protein [Cupriavidus gilardii]